MEKAIAQILKLQEVLHSAFPWPSGIFQIYSDRLPTLTHLSQQISFAFKSNKVIWEREGVRNPA